MVEIFTVLFIGIAGVTFTMALLNILKEPKKKCCCPEGSLCEFFEKDTENCLYGEK